MLLMSTGDFQALKIQAQYLCKVAGGSDEACQVAKEAPAP